MLCHAVVVVASMERTYLHHTYVLIRTHTHTHARTKIMLVDRNT